MKANPYPLPVCDGCNQHMTWEDYSAHNCPAYKHHKYKNPLTHKMAKSAWKVPGIKGTINAQGRSLTQGDIEMAKKAKGSTPKGAGWLALLKEHKVALAGVAVAMLLVWLIVNTYG